MTTTRRALRSGHRGLAALRRRRMRFGIASLGLLSVLLAATIFGFLALRSHEQSTENRLLRTESQQGVTVFNAVAQEVEATVSGGASVATATDGDAAAFEAVTAERVGNGFISSLALFRVTPEGVEQISHAGRRGAVLPERGGDEFADRMRSLAEAGSLELVSLETVDDTRVIGLAGAAGANSEYIVYAEVLIPEIIALSGAEDPEAFQWALYFGDEVGSALATTNASVLPIQGRRVTTRLRIGDERPTFVFGTTRPLAGTLTRAIPWIVLIAGLAFAVVLATLTESSRRRRWQARALVEDLGRTSDRLDRSEQRLAELFEQANDLIFVTDLDGALTSVNPAFVSATGYSRAELIGRTFDTLVAPSYRDRARVAHERKISGHVNSTTYEVGLTRRDGSIVELEVTSQLTRDAGEAIGVQAIARDLTERKRLEARFRSLVQNASDVILVVDSDSSVSYVTPSAGPVLGREEAALQGQRLSTLLHPDDRVRLLAFLDAAAHGREPGTIEARVPAAEGRWRTVEITANDLTADPAVGGIVLTVYDVTVRKELEEQLTYQAFHDPLTGLANRALFADRVSHALLHRSHPGSRIAVLFIDLDDFKTVNDSLGHDAGDQLLVQFGDRLRAGLRLGDTCARLGGDEFGVLLEQVPDAGYAVSVAERIAESLAEPVMIDGRQLVVQGSVGVAVQDPRGESAHELLRNADIAMYLAKRDPVTRCRVFEPYMHRAALERLELKGQLERALERDEFAIEYQPIVRVLTGEVEAVEALVRWQHPERGLLPPSDFVELAEESGLIVPLGRWVLDEACAAHAAWGAASERAGRVALSVNLSARQLLAAGLTRQISEILERHGRDPNELILEITESDLARDHDAAIARLEQLRDLGIRVAVDDFGTGYSSLSLLQDYPVDVLKIAKPFVDDLSDASSGTLARAIVTLAGTLGLETVAEGIEHDAQRAELVELGCDFGQGFLYSRPLAAEDVADALERWAADRHRTRLDDARSASPR